MPANPLFEPTPVTKVVTTAAGSNLVHGRAASDIEIAGVIEG